MSNEKFIEYISNLSGRLTEKGFSNSSKKSKGGAEGVWHRRKIELSKFSLVDTFVCVGFLPSKDLGIDKVKNFSAASFDFAIENKSWLPRGLFGMAVVFPLIVTDDVSEDVKSFITDHYCPKHWASAEFPAVLSLNTGKLTFLEK